VVNKPASDEETRERRQSKDAFDPLIGQADSENSLEGRRGEESGSVDVRARVRV